MPNWNLEKIYLENVTGVGNIPQQRHIVREFNSKADVKKAIVSANPNIKLGSDKRGAIRVAPAAKIEDREAFTREFLDTLNDINLVVVGEIEPGAPDSPSSKFMSYKVNDKTGNEFVITLAGGSFSNKGMLYERDVLEALSKYFDNPEEEEKPRFLESLEDALDVTFVGLDTETSFTRRVKRPLSDKGPTDRGNEISDITLIDEDDDKYYISLKDIGGKTVGNSGAAGLFDVDDGKVKFSNKDKGNVGKKLFDAANVDTDLIVSGLTDYINKRESNSDQIETYETTDESDKDDLLDFIGSAFDYGYIYVKRKNAKNDLEIADLSDKESLYDFIGDIEKVSVKYPYYKNDRQSRKHLSIMIKTSNGNYSFDVRNASGGIIPNQINLVRGSSAKDEKAAKASISKLDRSSNELEDILSQYD
jgi:hypothetical protein